MNLELLSLSGSGCQEKLKCNLTRVECRFPVQIKSNIYPGSEPLLGRFTLENLLASAACNSVHASEVCYRFPISASFCSKIKSRHMAFVWCKKEVEMWPVERYSSARGARELCRPYDGYLVGHCWNFLHCTCGQFMTSLFQCFVECNWVYSCVVIRWRA
jgi:hypothetical protein